MLYLVRHGRTQANAQGLLQGRINPPLDHEGERQAAAVATAIRRPDLLISSPLRRARETAAAFGVEPVIDERWIEVDYGRWDGTALADVSDDSWRVWRGDPLFAPPGGESLAELDARVRSAVESLVDAARHSTVVVVSHVTPIKAAVLWAMGVDDILATWRCRLDQAAVCQVQVSEAGPALYRFNEVHW
jgi:broad specificity phosphatase PhoE